MENETGNANKTKEPWGCGGLLRLKNWCDFLPWFFVSATDGTAKNPQKLSWIWFLGFN
jgi:hypothetical protein